MVWLADGEESFMTRLPVSTEYRRVTDGRTDIFRQHKGKKVKAWTLAIAPLT